MVLADWIIRLPGDTQRIVSNSLVFAYAGLAHALFRASTRRSFGILYQASKLRQALYLFTIAKTARNKAP
jgi:hypothetical protein